MGSTSAPPCARAARVAFPLSESKGGGFCEKLAYQPAKPLEHRPVKVGGGYQPVTTGEQKPKPPPTAP
jgi:hypothetical protein